LITDKNKTMTMLNSTVFNENALPALQPLNGKKTRIKPGVITFCELDGDMRKCFYLYRPLAGIHHDALFVTIHGISRNAYEQVLGFIPYAERYGVTVIAPMFSKALFGRYQKMGQTGSEQRADRYFDEIIAQAGQLTAVNPDKFYLFGYSGGAQFAHRYMMAYPERVASIAIGAAGWYTFPDSDLTYPLGIKQASRWFDLSFCPKNFLAIPTLVLVGEYDTRRDSTLRKSQKIDHLQGMNRLERGIAWINALNKLARQLGVQHKQHRFVQLPGSNHSFRRCIKKGGMANHIFRHFFNH